LVNNIFTFIKIKSIYLFLAQFDALNAELEHRRREQIEMKSKLQERVMQHENETDDVIATDAIEQAYQSQKQINK
jgi:guanylate kinase